MTTTRALTDLRINGIVARQSASRIRDLVFAALLAIGIGLSLGALRTADAQVSALPQPTVSA